MIKRTREDKDGENRNSLEAEGKFRFSARGLYIESGNVGLATDPCSPGVTFAQSAREGARGRGQAY